MLNANVAFANGANHIGEVRTVSVRELAAGVVASSEEAAPDDRTAAVLRLKRTEPQRRGKKKVLSHAHLL